MLVFLYPQTLKGEKHQNLIELVKYVVYGTVQIWGCPLSRNFDWNKVTKHTDVGFIHPRRKVKIFIKSYSVHKVNTLVIK